MKKTIYLVSVLLFLLGCASTPESKEPLDDSVVKLHRAKEIQCSFTFIKGVNIILTEGELEVEQEVDQAEEFGEYADFKLRVRIQIKIDTKSDNATINVFYDGEPYYLINAKVQRWDESISFILDDDWGGYIATIVAFNADDDLSDYEATFTASGYDNVYEILNFLGSCKVIE